MNPSDTELNFVFYTPVDYSGFSWFRHISNGVIERMPTDSINHPVYGFDLEFWPIPPEYLFLKDNTMGYPTNIIYPQD